MCLDGQPVSGDAISRPLRSGLSCGLPLRFKHEGLVERSQIEVMAPAISPSTARLIDQFCHMCLRAKVFYLPTDVAVNFLIRW